MAGRPKKTYEWDGYKTRKELQQMFGVSQPRIVVILKSLNIERWDMIVEGKLIPSYKIVN